MNRLCGMERHCEGFDEKWTWFCMYLAWEISWLAEPWEGRKDDSILNTVVKGGL